MPPHVQRLLDAFGASPAFVLTPAWSIVGWNRAYGGLYPHVAGLEPRDRNLLWLVFTDPYVRDFLPDWTSDSRRFLTQFRAEAGVRVQESEFVELIHRLHEVSEHFRQGWASYDVEEFVSRERWFQHPVAGTLLLEHHRLAVSDCPDLHLGVYTPSTDGTSDALDTLFHGHGTPPPTSWHG